jgi:Flp pilus assembly protein TadG
VTAREDQGGSSVVEFIGAATLVVMLLLSVIEVATYAYAGNVAHHAAHEGARAGAELGRTETDGALVARTLLSDELGSVGRTFEVRAVHSSGLSIVEVRGVAPPVLPLVPGLSVHARSEVTLEEPPR